MGKINYRKTKRLIGWNIICIIIGIIIALIPDLFGLFGLFFDEPVYSISIWFYILCGIIAGEIFFFKFIIKYVNNLH